MSMDYNVRVLGIASKGMKPWAELYGNSSVTKPVGKYCGGSLFRETDTGKKFRYDDVTGQWYEEATGGGGAEVDDITIGKNADGKLEVKDGGIGEEKLDGELKNKVNKDFASLERLGNYLYKVTFDTVPDYVDGNSTPIGGCSAFVRDGKLYRNYDWAYDNMAEFIVKCKTFEGTGAIIGLEDGALDMAKVGQLPYHLIDGVNTDGIMVSTHVLYNDFGYEGSGDKDQRIMGLPYFILSNVHSIADLESTIADYLANLNIPAELAAMEYLVQFIVTDGTTTKVITPKEDGSGYEVVDATDNPKLTNFKWVADATVVRTALQNRPTGVERWNLIGADTTLEDLRFTLAYESPTRLSEFIGINETTKSSTDEELTAIYNEARAEFLTRTRNGVTWQTVHSVVYDTNGMESLCVQEDYAKNYIPQEEEPPIKSVNGKTGNVVLEAEDIEDDKGKTVQDRLDESMVYHDKQPRHWKLMATVSDTERIKLLTNQYTNNIVYFNNKYIIADDGAVWVSSDDGVTWQKITLSESIDARRSLVHNDTCCIIGDVNTSGKVAVSSDGLNWQVVSIGTEHSGAEKTNNIYVNGNKFQIFTSNYVFESEDGLNWTETALTIMPSGYSLLNTEKSYGNGIYLEGTSKTNRFRSADGGYTWEKVENFKNGVLWFMNGLFYKCGSGSSGTISTSADGITWAETGIHPPTTDLVALNNKAISYGKTATYLSDNGLEFETIEAPYSFASVDYVNGRFVAIYVKPSTEGGGTYLYELMDETPSKITQKDEDITTKVKELVGGHDFAEIKNSAIGAGLEKSTDGTQIKHSNSITAGTMGQSTASSGGETLDIPYATYDEQGHITATGVHTHTINPATENTFGVIKVGTGLSMESGQLFTVAATDSEIEAGTDQHKVITPSNLATIKNLFLPASSSTVDDIITVKDSNITVDAAYACVTGGVITLYLRLTFAEAKDYSNTAIFNLKSPYKPKSMGNLGRLPVTHSSNKTSPLYCQRNDLSIFLYNYSTYSNGYMYGSVQAGETIQISASYFG